MYAFELPVDGAVHLCQRQRQRPDPASTSCAAGRTGWLTVRFEVVGGVDSDLAEEANHAGLGADPEHQHVARLGLRMSHVRKSRAWRTGGRADADKSYMDESWMDGREDGRGRVRISEESTKRGGKRKGEKPRTRR